MAMTEYTLTDADIGKVLAPASGFLVNLAQTAPASPTFETPWGDPDGRWRAGYLQLRGEGDCRRDLICFSPQEGQPFGQAMPPISGQSIGGLVVNKSLPFRGGLKILAVPRGSQWSLTLSDTPNVRAPTTPYPANFVGSNYTPRNPPAGPKQPGEGARAS